MAFILNEDIRQELTLAFEICENCIVEKKQQICLTFIVQTNLLFLFLFIFFVNDIESLQHQFFIQDDLPFAVLYDALCQASCGDHSCLASHLFFDSFNHSVHSRCIAVLNTALHAFDRILADDVLRSFQADAAELGCTGCQCIQGNARSRKDHTAYVLFFIIYYRQCGCRSHIDDDLRHRIIVDSCHCVCHQIGTQLCRIIDLNIQSGFHTCRQYQHFFFQDLLCGNLHNVGDLRYYRRNNASFNLIRTDLVDVQQKLNIYGIFQFCLGTYCGKSFYKMCFLFVDTTNHDVGISDIYGQNH